MATVKKIYPIEGRKEFNETLRDSVIRRGNFVWDDMNTHQVSFHDDPEGFFEVSWMPHKEARCKFEYSNRGDRQPFKAIVKRSKFKVFINKLFN